MSLIAALVPKQPVPLAAAELLALLPQPCQQPGCSQRFQALGPDGSQKDAAFCQGGSTQQWAAVPQPVPSRRAAAVNKPLLIWRAMFNGNVPALNKQD